MEATKLKESVLDQLAKIRKMGLQALCNHRWTATERGSVCDNCELEINY